MSATSVGEIGLDLVVNQNQFNKQMSGITSLAKKAGAALAGAFAVKQVVDFGKQCMELGSDLQEVQNVVDITFPSMTAQVDKFAKSAAQSFGLSETMAKRYTGTFGAMAKSFGFAEQDAYNMSTALTGLAGDVASFYNITQDEAYTKLKSVFTGETESLKDLGVVMTETALDAYAMANGFGKTTNEMSEAEKVALRYQFVLDQLSLASGDFARTSNSWANQMRILNLQFDTFKATIGQGLINLFTPLLQVVNKLMAKLIKLAEIFKGFTELITGKKSQDGVVSETAQDIQDIADNAGSASSGLSDMSDAAKSAAQDTSAATDAASDVNDDTSSTADTAKNNLSGASGAAKDLASNTTAAGKAAKKAAKEMKSLMGFDQINKLSEQNLDSSTDSPSDGKKPSGNSGKKPSGSGSGKNPSSGKKPSGSSAGGVPSGIAGIVGAENLGQAAQGDTVLDKWFDKFDAIIKRAKELASLFNKGFWKGLGDYKPYLKELEKDLKSIGKNLKDIFQDPGVQKAAKRFVDSIAYNLGLVAGSSARLGLAIAVNLVGGLEAYLSKNKDRIKKWLIENFDTGTEINNQVGEFALALADIFAPVFSDQAAQNITGNIIGFFATIGATVAELALKLGRDLLKFFTQPIIDNKDKIRDAFLGMLKPLSSATDTIENFVQYISDKLRELYDQNLKPFVENIINGISEIIGTITDGWNTYVLPVIDELAQKFKKVFDEDMRKMVDDIVGFFARIINALNDLWVNYLQPFLNWVAENIMPIVAQVIGFIGDLAVGNFELIAQIVSDIIEILNGFLTFLSGIFTLDIDKIFAGLGQILEGFKHIAEDIFNFIRDYIFKPFDDWLSGVFKTDFSQNFGEFGKTLNAFRDNASEVWEGVKKFFRSGADFIKSILDGDIKGAFTSFKDAVVGIFEVLLGAIKIPINGIIGVINGLIRGITGGINGAIDALNSLHFTVPDWVPFPGIAGKSFGFSIGRISAPQIPYLAQGGYVKPNTPQLAMIGDNRHQGEVVAPEGKLLEMAQMAAMMSGNNASNKELIELLRKILKYLENHDLVEIDPEQLRKYFIKKTNNNTKAKGVCELIT